MGRIETKPTTAQLLFPCGICEAVEGIAPWKSGRKQFGIVLVDLLEPGLGIGAIGEKTFILVI